MRLIFMGTPRFAVPSLEYLMDSPHEIALVVTQPDRKTGRGRTLKGPPVKETAEKAGLTVFQPSTLRSGDALDRIETVQADLIVVVAYGKILPKQVLDMPRYGCINAHASLLPKFRGAAPVHWAIICGEKETGVTIMKMDEGMDTGNILLTEKVEILDDDDAESLSNMLSMLSAQNLLRVIEAIEAKGGLEGTPQDEDAASYAPMLTKEDGLIHWNESTERIVCLVRGVYPWPGAQTTLHEDAFKIIRADAAWEGLLEKAENPEAAPPGAVVAINREQGLVVRSKTGYVLVKEAQPAGKRVLTAQELVNGKFVKVGDQFGVKEDKA